MRDPVPDQRVRFRPNPQPRATCNTRITTASISRQFRSWSFRLAAAGLPFAAQTTKKIGAAHGRPGLRFAWLL